jgi:GT2 family glycosyltransferase
MKPIYDVSIVILAHNSADKTEYCLQSILDASVYPREIFVANNGSTDRTPELLHSFEKSFQDAGIPYSHWTNSENMGCSIARNEAWAKATQPYVIFMDNDTAVCTSNWLEIFVNHMNADPKLGVLGPKLIYPFKPHAIQCAGVDLSPSGRVRFSSRGDARDSRDAGTFRKVSVLISACWIMRRDFLETIGGLDEHFHPVQYEDLDFCMKVNQAGYYCAYTPDVEIYHFEGTTTAASGQMNYIRVIVENSSKFRERWKDELASLPEDDGDFTWKDINTFNLSNELDLSQAQ